MSRSSSSAEKESIETCKEEMPVEAASVVALVGSSKKVPNDAESPKQEQSKSKAEAVEALMKQIAKIVESSDKKSANKKKASPKMVNASTPSKSNDVETPKKPTTAGRVKKTRTSNDKSPQQLPSAPTQNNNTNSITPTSDEHKKGKSPRNAGKQKQKNLSVYVEELLYELSCLDLAQSENVFPFKSNHLRRLVNQELVLVRSQLSEKTQMPPCLNIVPSPGVRRLTVFPEELVVPSINCGNIVDGCGDVSSMPGRLPWRRNIMSNEMNSAQNIGSQFSSLLSSFNSSLSPQGSPILPGQMFAMSHKIYIPEHPSYNFIGRILGPRGNSVRRLEALTGCKILIRGKGSIKDPSRELKLRNAPGWEHLKDALHVLITAEDLNEHVCNMKLHRAAANVQRLLTPMFDDYKRHQLIQLAIINGTYRP